MNKTFILQVFRQFTFTYRTFEGNPDFWNDSLKDRCTDIPVDKVESDKVLNTQSYFIYYLKLKVTQC